VVQRGSGVDKRFPFPVDTRALSVCVARRVMETRRVLKVGYQNWAVPWDGEPKGYSTYAVKKTGEEYDEGPPEPDVRYCNHDVPGGCADCRAQWAIEEAEKDPNWKSPYGSVEERLGSLWSRLARRTTRASWWIAQDGY